jgi:hypothetical protein
MRQIRHRRALIHVSKSLHELTATVLTIPAGMVEVEALARAITALDSRNSYTHRVSKRDHQAMIRGTLAMFCLSDRQGACGNCPVCVKHRWVCAAGEALSLGVTNGIP